jgi:hypothetical protein
MAGTWRDSVKLVDSILIDESERAEKLLRLELTENDTPAEAAWALGLFCVKRHDGEAVERVINGVAKKFPTHSDAVSLAMSRLQLWQALNQNNPEAVNERLAKLIDETIQLGSGEDFSCTAAFLGSVCGMLDNDRSESPLEAKTIHRTKQRFLESSDQNVRSSFIQSYDLALAKAKQFEERVKALEEIRAEELKSNLEKGAAELEQLKLNQVANRESLNQIEKSNERRLKDLAAERKRMETALTKLSKDARTATPGHPGNLNPPPRPPNRSLIFVDPYQVIIDVVIDKNGNRTDVQRTVPKSYYQIEAERDDRFRILQAEYSVVKATYDQYANRFRQQLDSWTKRDQERRDKNAAEQQRGNEQLAAIRDEFEKLKSENDEASQLLARQNIELKRLQAQLTLDQAVIPAIIENNLSGLFRPAHFELFNYGREKRWLQSVAGARDQGK